MPDPRTLLPPHAPSRRSWPPSRRGAASSKASWNSWRPSTRRAARRKKAEASEHAVGDETDKQLSATAPAFSASAVGACSCKGYSAAECAAGCNLRNRVPQRVSQRARITNGVLGRQLVDDLVQYLRAAAVQPARTEAA